MVCSDTSRGRQSRCLALRSHELRAYCNFESKQAISTTLFGRRLNNNILIISNTWLNLHNEVIWRHYDVTSTVEFTSKIQIWANF